MAVPSFQMSHTLWGKVGFGPNSMGKSWLWAKLYWEKLPLSKGPWEKLYMAQAPLENLPLSQTLLEQNYLQAKVPGKSWI